MKFLRRYLASEDVCGLRQAVDDLHQSYRPLAANRRAPVSPILAKLPMLFRLR